ncbi:MAG: DUF2779 domain-containing protein, partial [Clostridia bacterium]|nr:DUF2779 domain-containing protein [Clostridia bacterium]
QIMCHDGAYQMFVLAACGIKISQVMFVHTNGDYVQGKTDPSLLFVEERITSRTKSALSSVEKRVTAALSVLKCRNFPEIPLHNGCFAPYDCECRDVCFGRLPQKNIFDISGMNRQIKFKMYSRGNVSVVDALNDPLLPEIQRHQIEMYLNDSPPEIKIPELRRFVSGLTYPMYFLDFESMQLPIPVFKGTRPFEQVAFQYSLHCLKDKNSDPEFKSFIAKPGEDPRRSMAESLARDIPPDACVVTYACQLEKKVLATLAGMYPDLRKKLMRIHNNIKDIMIPFEKRYYYHGGMLGANSLKAVLHALYPEEKELDYKRLEGIHNGKEAAVAYAMATAGAVTGADADKIDPHTVVQELLRYCSLDTLALIKILQKFNEALDGEKCGTQDEYREAVPPCGAYAER